MKKHYYLYIVAILALIAVLPVAVRAEEGTDDTATPPPVTGQVPPGTVPPPPRPGTFVPNLIREQLRGGKAENIQNNVELRNKNILENRRIGSSTRPEMRPGLKLASSTRAERREIRDDRREEVGDIRREGREDMKNASSSGERREIRKDMRMDIFRIRKDAIIKQLTVSLNNLKQIRDRIASRIEKAASEGRDMTNAKSALVAADAKILVAINAVEALKAYTAPTATTTASSTDPIVDLTKPRQVGDAAIKAVKAAHEALVAVVRAIAHAMGLGNNATTTPPVIPPTPTSTPTGTNPASTTATSTQ